MRVEENLVVNREGHDQSLPSIPDGTSYHRQKIDPEEVQSIDPIDREVTGVCPLGRRRFEGRALGPELLAGTIRWCRRRLL
jgi:hypothetical protein